MASISRLQYLRSAGWKYQNLRGYRSGHSENEIHGGHCDQACRFALVEPHGWYAEVVYTNGEQYSGTWHISQVSRTISLG